MPLQQTSGNATADAFGGVAVVPAYIEDIFSTYLYTGNQTARTITTGINTELVWIKGRNVAGLNHYLHDYINRASGGLISNLTNGLVNQARVTAMSSTGFSLAAGDPSGSFNTTGTDYVSWSWTQKTKFFDIVNYTGTGSAQNIAHELGSVPGCIIVKRTDASANWQVYHRSLTSAANSMQLNLTNAQASAPTVWNSTAPTSSVFSVGTDATVNASGGTYVAYIFAHNAGGFGLTGTDNVISCGSFNSTALNNLGWEPQFVMMKRTDSTSGWLMFDNMRGLTAKTGFTNNSNFLYANTSDVETGGAGIIGLDPLGFSSGQSGTYIYIAIRRGPMKVPTDGTKVFGLSARTGTGANATVTGSAGVSDAVLIKNRGAAVGDLFASRLTGTGYTETSSNAAEVAAGVTVLQANPWDVMDGVKVGTTSTITNASANTYINYLFKRAPGFFDEVCYAGTGSNLTVAHNLTVVPQLIIIKNRTNGWSWNVGYNFGVSSYDFLTLDNNDPGTGNVYNSHYTAAPTATQFFLATNVRVNQSSANFVAYLFATLAGISKVGSYTGNGTTQAIACGFAGGARFVLIKRTDAVGDWYTYDTARGMTLLTDPYLLLNSTAAETATLGSVTSTTGGFTVNAAILAAINVTSATYIFLAIA